MQRQFMNRHEKTNFKNMIEKTQQQFLNKAGFFFSASVYSLKSKPTVFLPNCHKTCTAYSLNSRSARGLPPDHSKTTVGDPFFHSASFSLFQCIHTLKVSKSFLTFLKPFMDVCLLACELERDVVRLKLRIFVVTK